MPTAATAATTAAELPADLQHLLPELPPGWRLVVTTQPPDPLPTYTLSDHHDTPIFTARAPANMRLLIWGVAAGYRAAANMDAIE